MNIKKIVPAIVLSGAALALTACGSSAPNGVRFTDEVLQGSAHRRER